MSLFIVFLCSVPSHLLFFFFLMIRRPPRSTLFPYHDALPISGLRREADPGDRILVGAGDQRVQAQPQGRHERRPAHHAPAGRPAAYLEPPLLGRSEAPERLALAGGRRPEDLAAAVHDLGVRAQRGDELLQSRLLDGPEQRFALLVPLLEPRGGVGTGAGQGLQHEPTRFAGNEAAALTPP